MNGAVSLPLSDLVLTLPRNLQYSSESDVEKIDEITEREKIITGKFRLLEKNIGQGLFKQLSYEQKSFIANVSGTINLGVFVDIEKMYDLLEKIEHE